MKWLWPIVIILSAVIAGLANFVSPNFPGRPVLLFWFLFVCPGMALIRCFKLKGLVTEWTLAIVLSMVIDMTIAGIQVYADHWSALVALSIVISICILGVLAQIIQIRFDADSRFALVIGPYFLPFVVCNDYDPRAPAVARILASMIASRSDSLIVEHVGSTSVPGCAGKGVIDLMVLYPQGQLEEAKRILAGLGFQRQFTVDPQPEERPMRTGSLEYQGSTFRVHIHVLAMDSLEVEELRRFRDRLKADTRLVTAYTAHKQRIIAAGITDSIEYARAKGSFVQSVLANS